MKRVISKLLFKYPSFLLFSQLFLSRVKTVKGSLQEVHDKYANPKIENSIAVDLGCGPNPLNRFKATQVYGVDLYEDKKKRVFKCRLGYEKLPFDDDSIDYLTAYDLLEHIPRYSELNENGNTPFIFLMNECYRVLKKNGIFLSMTPIYPFFGAFQDPTHNNIMTAKTLEFYFSNKKIEIAEHYGITSNFEIAYQGMLGQHLVAALRK